MPNSPLPPHRRPYGNFGEEDKRFRLSGSRQGHVLGL